MGERHRWTALLEQVGAGENVAGAVGAHAGVGGPAGARFAPNVDEQRADGAMVGRAAGIDDRDGGEAVTGVCSR
jgi:hypothetical protein